jgi:hypothetical protein
MQGAAILGSKLRPAVNSTVTGGPSGMRGSTKGGSEIAGVLDSRTIRKPDEMNQGVVSYNGHPTDVKLKNNSFFEPLESMNEHTESNIGEEITSEHRVNSSNVSIKLSANNI